MSSGYRVSLARIASVVFTVFVLAFAHGAYITYCVLPRIYEADAKIEVPRLDISGPIHNELEIINSPDVLSPIITDLELDKIWAKRLKLAIDQVPMQDALGYLNKNLRFDCAPGSSVITITVSSEVPKEASDVANAVADRYQSVREADSKRLFEARENVIGDEITEQENVAAQKLSAVETIRSQLDKAGIHIAPGAAGLIAADLAMQKNGSTAQVDALAPLRAAQAELDAQEKALDDLRLKLRQAKNDYHLTESPVRIISLADPPERPALPDVSLNLGRAAMEGAALAVAAAILLELAMWYFLRQRPAPPQVAHPSPPGVASADY
jgi:uncharacterized protein involved in exopolysaccharide biosynthesis